MKLANELTMPLTDMPTKSSSTNTELQIMFGSENQHAITISDLNKVMHAQHNKQHLVMWVLDLTLQQQQEAKETALLFQYWGQYVQQQLGTPFASSLVLCHLQQEHQQQQQLGNVNCSLMVEFLTDPVRSYIAHMLHEDADNILEGHYFLNKSPLDNLYKLMIQNYIIPNIMRRQVDDDDIENVENKKRSSVLVDGGTSTASNDHTTAPYNAMAHLHACFLLLQACYKYSTCQTSAEHHAFTSSPTFSFEHEQQAFDELRAQVIHFLQTCAAQRRELLQRLHEQANE